MSDDAPDTPGRFERAMARSVPLWLVVLLAGLGFFAAIGMAALVRYSAQGGQRLASARGVAVALADAPTLVMNLRERTRDPFRVADAKPGDPVGFWRDPARVDDGYLLLTHYDGATRRPGIRLLRLADGVVLREFRPPAEALGALARQRATAVTDAEGVPYQYGHPDLMADGGLMFVGNYLLARTDACGRPRWTVHGLHHAIERGIDGGTWTPGVMPRPIRVGAKPKYHDDVVVRVTPAGGIAYQRSLDRIFADNRLDVLVRGRAYTDDPYHLNDIEPVFADGPYWRRGDVFLSLRNLSLVLLYRPSTGRVLWSRTGPWFGQHDVRILDDHRIAVFDNNAELGASGGIQRGVSNELVYDFATGAVDAPWSRGFHRLGIATTSNGRGTTMADGDLIVEETNGGRIVRMGRDGSERWRYVLGTADGRRYRLFWSRYLDARSYGAAITASVEARCP